MQNFVRTAVVLALLNGGSFALPSKSGATTQSESGFWYPEYAPTRGSVSANGANGGYNYNGDGSNGGYIGIGVQPTGSGGYYGGGSVYASGSNGGENRYGSGANGGSISIGKREPEKDFFFPIWRPYSPPTNGPISATGANGGYNYGGNGANGGSISIAKREEDFFFPIWRPYSPPTNGAISANGANGGYNYGGDGANGGTISIGRRDHEEHSALLGIPSYRRLMDFRGKRELESKRDDDFFIPFFGAGWNQPPVNGAITAEGANGGTNHHGNGANGGSISINRREDEFFYPVYGGWNRPAMNGAISANGANGGTNYYGNGANGGAISVGRGY